MFALPLASSPPFDTGSLRDTDPAAPPTEQITMYDYLKVPAHLSPGEYVLGFRWDCESSAQVWQSCADITVE